MSSQDFSPASHSLYAEDGNGEAGAAAEAPARQRYWRADNQRSDSAGLGLSIVTRIMEVHDAELAIESAPVGGARFLMYFSQALLQSPQNPYRTNGRVEYGSRTG